MLGRFGMVGKMGLLRFNANLIILQFLLPNLSMDVTKFYLLHVTM